MDLLSLVTLIVILAIIGFALWLVVTYIPMPVPFQRVILVVVAVLVLVWLLRVLLGGGGLTLVR
jgi:hypothetical protein